MPYITDEALKDAVAAALNLASAADLPDFWDDIVTNSNESAYQDIVRRLQARGYTLAQIDAWGSRIEFNRDIGLYWSLVKGAGTAGFDDKFIARLDRRLELDEVYVDVEDADGPQPIGHGRLSTADDVVGNKAW